jgi:uncharacterized membrane protein YhaH (DUF805 family)
MFMNIGEATATCLKKYFIFSGRAKRSEFWWFYLFTVLVTVMYTIVFNYLLAAWVADGCSFKPGVFACGEINIMTIPVLSNLSNLLLLIPTLAAGSRRLHDIGKSSWWLLLLITVIGIIPLVVWWATNTKPEGDKYSEAAAETA